MYTQKLAETVRWQVVTDYRPGAGTTIGAAYVARATPDGYTLLAASPSLVIAPVVYSSLPYDTVKSFAPVSLMSKRSSLLMVHPSVPVKTAVEYFTYLRANPGKVNFGTSGAGGNTHLAAEWLHSLTKTSVTYVHYKGASPLQTDIMAGRIQATFSTPLTMIPLIRNGTLRALAATSTTRVARLPDVPTLVEQGVAGYDHNFWMGYVAPSATPAAVLAKLNAEFSKVAKAPDIVQKMADEGNQTVGSSVEEFRQYIGAELVRVRKLVQETGIVPE